jgi:hypothetical protein
MWRHRDDRTCYGSLKIFTITACGHKGENHFPMDCHTRHAMDMCGCEPGFHRHPMSAPDVTLVLTGCMAVINITKLAEKNSKET